MRRFYREYFLMKVFFSPLSFDNVSFFSAMTFPSCQLLIKSATAHQSRERVWKENKKLELLWIVGTIFFNLVYRKSKVLSKFAGKKNRGQLVVQLST